MAGATSGGTATIPAAAIPQKTGPRWTELQRHFGNLLITAGQGGNIEATRALVRVECVMLSMDRQWNADQVSEFLGGTPTQEDINLYLTAYNNNGIEGLGRAPAGAESFYSRGTK